MINYDMIGFLTEKNLNEFTYYFNELLRESALYVRGFLDTKDQHIFDMARFYVNAFANLTEKYLNESYLRYFGLSLVRREQEKNLGAAPIGWVLYNMQFCLILTTTVQRHQQLHLTCV